eukprot:CAMPEP_0195293496 /NCGR_PEP_ID=MMETSP0707-20130614/12573_1 /TAXON_ID=33640 /ORGANISM="Asterionellopsis glacialis, Strain CCMP134" /LENGTH=52 /DNA_ID=CAMNT_0040354223 /DNA_START=27 /DNA_END=185 /DNA_ORIENTATION=-
MIDTNAADTTKTTPLLNRFLLLAVLWMAMAAFAAMAVDTPPSIVDAPPAVVK